jgi:hypothetical protein
MPWYVFKSVQHVEYMDELWPTPVNEYDFFLDEQPDNVLDDHLKEIFRSIDYSARSWEPVADSEVPDYAVDKIIEHRRAAIQHSMEVLFALGAGKEDPT